MNSHLNRKMHLPKISDIPDILIPLIWIRNWDTMSNEERKFNIALDALCVVPVAGILGRTAIETVSRTVGETAARSLEKKVVKGPIETLATRAEVKLRERMKD